MLYDSIDWFCTVLAMRQLSYEQVGAMLPTVHCYSHTNSQP